jgi:hypothetical protein
VKIGKGLMCPEEKFSVSDPAQTGTFTFRADGTSAQTVRTTGTLVDVFPPVCLTSGVRTCADIEAQNQELVRGGIFYSSASCVDNAGTCECTLTVDRTTSGSGTYTTSGSTLTLMADSASSTGTYCVTGSTLITSFSSTPGDTPVIYVFSRQ